MSKRKYETVTIIHINNDNLKHERNFAFVQMKFHLFASHSKIMRNTASSETFVTFTPPVTVLEQDHNRLTSFSNCDTVLKLPGFCGVQTQCNI